MREDDDDRGPIPAPRPERGPDGSGPLPNLLVLGAQKSGTTALAAALRTHPQVFLSARKELHHFGRVPDDEAGGAAYRANFADWSGQPWVMEATPNYMYLEAAGRQIAATLPHGFRGVVLLRNPVDRAYSAYWHGRSIGVLRGSFEECLEREPAELARGEWGFAALVDRGRYALQLRRLEQLGIARSQLHVMLYDDLVADEAGTLGGLATFLALDSPIDPLRRENVARRYALPAPVVRRLRDRGMRGGRAGRLAARALEASRRPFDYPPMTAPTRGRLVDRFRPANAELAEWLGRDLPDWDR